MFDVLAQTYITASRMDHWMMQESMYRDPRTAARLRHLHGLDDPSIGRALWGRVGMDGPIEQPHRPSRLVKFARRFIGWLGKALQRIGERIEQSVIAPCGQTAT